MSYYEVGEVWASPMTNPTEETWPELSRQARKRADWQCQCAGECGQHDGVCGAEHGERHPHPEAHDLPMHDRTGHKPERTTRIHTTFRNGNVLDWRIENLYAICTWCWSAMEVGDGRNEVKSDDTPTPRRRKRGRKDMPKPREMF